MQSTEFTGIRRCRDEERAVILDIVNTAAEAYRGVIPADCWHEPYMPPLELADEIAAGVEMWGYEASGRMIGVMGIQTVRDADLIRHAYVLPEYQGQGIGGALMSRLRRHSGRRMLVGTWAAATWAIRFYQRHDFQLLSPQSGRVLLKSYWSISDRQAETSVALVNAR